MQYSTLAGENVSKLGFGAMRFPLLEGGAIDESQACEMVLLAAEQGVNYFDTAYPYHNGLSEIVLGRALKQLPRESFFLATKYPGHQTAESYDPAAIFEEQLKKCGVDYFDFYLLHNIYERSLPVYEDERWGIIDYFLEQRAAGRIRHLGFSTHAQLPCLEAFLERHGAQMEFAQIQMNYLDWSLQDGPEKYALLERFGLDAIVMEPMRGGALADLGEEANARLRAIEPDRSIASWAMRWQLGTPAKVVLSGMSTPEQLADNIATFSEGKQLTPSQAALLDEITAGMKDDVPCTACGYCKSSCAQGIDIPLLMKLANDARVQPTFTLGMTLDSLAHGTRPQDCVGCRACEQMCPQNIAISEVLADFVQRMKDVPHWDDICKARFDAAEKLREGREGGEA